MISRRLLSVLPLVFAIAVVQLAGPTEGSKPISAARVAAGPPTSWSLKLSPARSPDTNVLNSVSCTSGKSCIAVGYYTAGSVDQTLTELFDGQSWTVVPSPDVGSGDNVFDSVACPASNLCVAVGSSTKASGSSQTLVASWDGSRWTVESSPNPGTKGNSLAGVACSGGDSCQAVGSSDNSGGGTATLAEAWNGDKWSVEPTPSPGGTAGVSSLAGVSCTSAVLCVAAGDYSLQSSSEGSALVESWNGRSWSVRTVPQVAETSDFFRGVSCTTESAFLCAAVGYEKTATGEQTFVVSWDGKGTKWSLASSPDPGTSLNQLNAVSCATNTFCVAVGFYSNGESKRNLAEVFTGSQWGVSTSASEGQGDNVSNGINCPKPRIFDISVGAFADIAPPTGGGAPTGESSADQTLIESYNGKAWRVAASPDKGDGDNELSAISCVSSTFCMAVGSYDRKNSFDYRNVDDIRTLIESWDGTQWSIVSSPNDGPSLNVLSGVSCVNRQFCIAVGAHGIENPGQLIESWNGESWSVTPNPVPSDTSLASVSCTTTQFCAAVGTDSGDNSTLTELWNGSSWSEVPSPPRGRLPELSGVSCVNSTNCQAVGDYIKNKSGLLTLAELWNGSKWSITPTPDPGVSPSGPGTKADDLLGVSCDSPTNCVAVGRYIYHGNPHYFRPLIALWNGSKWILMAGAKLPWLGSSLDSVTCSSPADCVAAGYHLPDGFEVSRTMIESWNGTSWALTPSPNIGKSNFSSSDSLSGVSCPAASYCLAVGSFADKLKKAQQNLVLSGT